MSRRQQIINKLPYGTFLTECVVIGGGNISTELQSLTGFFHPLLMDFASILTAFFCDDRFMS